jgi:hypothetical protein
MTASSVRAELAAAVRAANAAYSRLPEDERPEVAWGEIDAALEEALNSGSRARAIRAIKDWRRCQLALLARKP